MAKLVSFSDESRAALERGVNALANAVKVTLLLIFTPLVIEQRSVIQIASLLLLIVVLGLKIRAEERNLREHFPGYGEYAAGTRRLLPWLI